MSEGLNRVTWIGNLGQDPELRFLERGQAVLRLRLATTEVYFDRDKAKKERTEWHSVTIWGKRGEALHAILAKGARILVEGRIQYSTSEKDGQKRTFTEIVATNVLLLGARGFGDKRESDAPQSSFKDDSFGGGSAEDDVPFAPREIW